MKKKFHFVGIGGIGMSALAHILCARGYIISGCDSNLNQKTISQLQQLGCTIAKQSSTHACFFDKNTTIVYSTAITDNNPDRILAKHTGLQQLHRSIVLANIMNNSYSVAITGSHGKTTTTSLLGHLLLQTDFNPTIISGGIINSIKSNVHVGEKKLIIAEADESDRSFLHLQPTAAIITNIDFEHAETYKDIDDIIKTYKIFITQILKKNVGPIVINGDDIHCKKLITQFKNNVISYGFEKQNDIIIFDYKLEPSCLSFRLSIDPDILYTFPMSGAHNIYNATAAFTMWYNIAHKALEKKNKAITALAHFSGIDRRFSVRGIFKGATIVDDYAHHPVEIANTIKIARLQTKGKLIIVFQPHRYSRTKALWSEFVSVLQDAVCDQIFVTDIYPASEQPIETISSKSLVKACKVKKIVYIPDIHTLKKNIIRNAKKNSLLLFLGAGDIYQIGIELVKKKHIKIQLGSINKI